VGGIVNTRRWFGPLLPGTDHIRHTFDPARRFTRGQAEVGQEYADDLLRLIDLHGAETIAAVIVEPMAGSTGVLPPPKGYLERLRKICTDHGILLIFDEVITAFGRVGAMTAAERVGVTPDLIALAKGISNGAIPMGAVAASRSIYETFMEKSASGIEFFHGYTTSAHPLAVAAASATLDLFAREKLCERALALEPGWEDAVHRLADARHVVDVRNFGLAAGIELAPRDGASGARANETLQQCFDAGLQIRTTGDTIALSPPVIFSPADVEETVAKIRSALDRVA
jgi:beta-alanine--pyruvate transaminase